MEIKTKLIGNKIYLKYYDLCCVVKGGGEGRGTDIKDT